MDEEHLTVACSDQYTAPDDGKHEDCTGYVMPAFNRLNVLCNCYCHSSTNLRRPGEAIKRYEEED